MMKMALFPFFSLSKALLFRQILPSAVIGRGTLKFRVHGGQRLYEFIPALCAEGKAQEIVGNLLFRCLDALRDHTNNRTELLKEFSNEIHETLECLFSPSPFSIPNKEMFFAILNADVVKIVSPKLKKVDSESVRMLFEDIFHQFFIQHSKMKSSVSINSLFHAVGASQFLSVLVLIDSSSKLRAHIATETFSTIFYQYLYGNKPNLFLAIQMAAFFAIEENTTLDTPLAGSSFTLKTVLKVVSEKCSEHLLDYFMKCLPQRELRDQVVLSFESRNFHTGLLHDEWGYAVTRKYALLSLQEKVLSESNVASGESVVKMSPNFTKLLRKPLIHPALLEVNEVNSPWKHSDLLARPVDWQKESGLLTLYEMQLNQVAASQQHQSAATAKQEQPSKSYQLPLPARKIYWIHSSKQLSMAFSILKHYFSCLYHDFGLQKQYAATHKMEKSTIEHDNADFLENNAILDTASITINFDTESTNHAFLVVALDIEWTAPQSVSLLTIATKESIFLIDMLNSDISYRNMTLHMLTWLFKNPFIIKLMYDHPNDARQLSFFFKTDALLAGIVNCIDLREPRILQTTEEEINSIVNEKTGRVKLATELAETSFRKHSSFTENVRAGVCSDSAAPDSSISSQCLTSQKEFLTELWMKEYHIINQKKTISPYRSTTLKCRSLSHLSKTILNATLDKSLRLSNWNTRPLSIPQLEYAASDAYVLLMLEIALRNKNWYPSKIIGKTHPHHWNV
ncbi:hypothetical protein IE077_002051 [Cardiosporidium cionae]|uniref:3'-5' exonuclease domain-containing protein n=1 Tax=Cardiosporidium cionae TaxID=476202 RepID=A0ABQ7JG15_9APIC|nr:hypothetical protein IE077_002051 [Cardiosporidium cionae]|eukprot:KAF8822911.1 hypothetical protein IE077_002051 [Cardiosporidium cionae]